MSEKAYIPRCPVKLALAALGPEAQSLRDDFAEALAVYAGSAAPQLASPDDADADTLVLFFAADDVPALPACAPDAHVYAVAISPGRDLAPAEDALAALAGRCDEMNLVFCGGIRIKNGARILREAGKARMGIWRRARSEAIDRLIFAVLAGSRIAA